MQEVITIRRTVNIFIGSSINEFREERHELVGYIYSVSDGFERRYGIRVRPLLCEYADPAMRADGAHKQEDYNDLIRESEMSFFIFFTRAGEFTRKEFELACGLMRANGRPKVYVYFKNVPEGTTAEASLREFMTQVDRDHYHGTFDSIDTIKLRILECLKFQEFEELSIEVKDGYVCVDGQRMLKLENITEFSNNRLLADLRAQLENVQEQYFPMKAEYEKRRSDPAFYRTYADIAAKRQSLLDEIEELEKQIFSLSLNMCRDAAHGDITPRQKEAYRLFEQGDLHGANAILDADEIEDEFLRFEREETRRLREGARRFIRQIRTKIEILSAMTDYADRFAEIGTLYEKIVPVAEKYLAETDVIYDYASYLSDQNDHTRALHAAQRLQALYDAHPDLGDDRARALLVNLTGIVYSDLHEYAKAEEYYLKAISLYKPLTDKRPDAFLPALASCYNNAGVLYNGLHDYAKAEENYLKAISLYKFLADKHPDVFRPALASCYSNAGVLYKNLHSYAKAVDCSLEAIIIHEALADKNPDAFNLNLAASYNNAGILYSDLCNYAKAEEYYLKAIAIREALADNNPNAFNPHLADSYNNAGNLYRDLHDYAKAETFFLKAIAIYEALADNNPEAFTPDLAMSYNNAGNLYYNLHDYAKAEKFYLKAIAIYQALADKNPEGFNPELATSYNNTGILYSKLCNYAKAEEYYLKAIAIREVLAVKNPDAFNPDLAASHNSTGVLYVRLHNYAKAIDYFQKAEVMYEKLCANAPDIYSESLEKIYTILLFLHQELAEEE